MKVRWWIVGYLLALAVALFSSLASSAPDGLERVALDQGFLYRASNAPPYVIIADYLFPGIGNKTIATILAGFVGVTIVYVLVAGGSYLLYRRALRRRRQA